MMRRGVVRFQVFLLVVLAGLLVWRATRGPDRPDAEVSFAALDSGELYSAAFRVETSGRVRVEAAGSVETEGETLPVAYPWILRMDDRSVVWVATPDSVEAGGTLFTVVDTVPLAAGVYKAWFTTFGQSERSRSSRGFLGLRHHWTNDARQWRFLLSPVDSIRIFETELPGPKDDRPDLVWESGPVRNRQLREALLLVDSDTSIRVRAITEVCASGCDEAAIEDARSGQVVWSIAKAETRPAGGSSRNRSFDGDLALQAGVYRVRYMTDASHAYGSWDANPPWDPDAWGISIDGPSDVVRRFDPWETSEPVVEMLSLGDDQMRSTAIDVSRPVSVVVDAMGEIWENEQRYDYAWIEREDRSRLWEMTWVQSMPAGGDRTNRREVAFLDLEPGRYVVYYQTDGAHAYGAWSRPKPEHPERWGVALFSLEAGAPDSAAVRVVEERANVPPDVAPPDPPAVPSPIPSVAGETLFAATGLGNDEDRTGEFVLPRPTRVRIVALGEISRQGRYDFGWIESESGDYVWEMTLGNTKPAGGDDSYRRFDSVVTLPAGRYRARFRTDFSNAFGDFGGAAPSDAAGWGMRIVRMPE